MSSVSSPELPVLLVDDEKQFLLSAGFTLDSLGITNLVECSDSRKVAHLLSEKNFSVIVLDINMPHISGEELLQLITREYPTNPVIMLTANNEVETAVACMKKGALDYLVKPVTDDALLTSINRAIEFWRIRNENTLLKKYLLSDDLEHPEAFDEIVTKHSSMRSIFQYLEAISPTPLPVLITGETGTGKELIARAIHKLSRLKGEFVSVNVAGVDDTLFSDTLFGHKKGSFTGAIKDRMGLIEKAAGGTLFLDEIGDLSMESQVKLLRLLQEGKYYSIGSDLFKISDARIIAATNIDLNAKQKTGQFRKDVYYRLQAHNVNITPLRKRKEDLELLIDHFLDKAAKNLGKANIKAPKELYTLLLNYSFPGNVRELEGLITDAVSRHKSGILSTTSFREKLHLDQLEQQKDSDQFSDFEPTESSQMLFPETLPTLKEFEKMLIDEALNRAENNQRIAAEILGMTRRALNNRLQRSSK